ncbi:MAG: response regulator [Nostocaceae cyanobacterium]|nr:response regulator [Nostocaceae cyanobacterium]
MTINAVFTTDELTRQIQVSIQEQFTGKLEIKHPQLPHLWILHFRQGHFVGCVNPVHPIRSWCQQISVHCPELPLYSGAPRTDRLLYWDYNYLAELVRQGKIRRQQMEAVVANHITEALFDIQQYSEKLYRSSNLSLSYKRIPADTIEPTDSTLVLIPAMNPCQRAMHRWEAWSQAGLIDYSPNLAPVIRQAMILRQQTSAAVYRNLISLADGNWTLRDLALKLKQKLVSLTQSIKPYIDQGLIELIEVEDFKESFQLVINNYQPSSGSTPTTVVSHQPKSPLIACIDDSQSDSLKMNSIITEAGYRFIHIQDPVKALVILLENKPDLIFLDLVMPVANGYEICTKIRRASALQDIPVIILTNNDGIIDRVRAKMVGASGFLAKPIEKDLVLKTVKQYMTVRNG